MYTQTTTGAGTNSLQFSLVLEPEGDEAFRRLKINLDESTKPGDSRWTLRRFYEVQKKFSSWQNIDIDAVDFVDDDEAVSAFRARVAEFAEKGREPRLLTYKRPEKDSDPRDYVLCHLQLLSTKASMPYRCYNVYDTVYRRLDRQPVTEKDVQVLKGLRGGQIHFVTVADDGLSVRVHSEVDSSD